MQQTAIFAADLVAVSVLVFGLYLRRHGRRDLIVAYLGVNVGVLSVTAVLNGAAVGVGLGLGLFGVLSIIRLRSTELGQQEVAYYFSALTLGLLGGIGTTEPWLPLGLMVLVLAVVYIGDHPRFSGRSSQQIVVLDRAVADPEQLSAQLSALLGVRVQSVTVQRLDLVNDTTTVEVRHDVRRSVALRAKAGIGR